MRAGSIQYIRKVFSPLDFFHILLHYSLVLKLFHSFFPPLSIYTQYPIMTKQKQVLDIHKYSEPLLSTLLKHLWQRLQPRVFLAHTCFCIYLLCRSSQALPGWMGSVAAHVRIGFKYVLWLGHSRAFRDLSRNHSCVVLAVCLRSLSCWKVHLCPSLRS